MTPAAVPLGPSSPVRVADEAAWRPLEVWAVLCLVGGAYAVPLVLPTLGGLLTVLSSRWRPWTRVAVAVAVLAPFGLVPVSGAAVVVAQTVTATVSGVLLALALRRPAG
ncbi:MAG: hypothetical protein HY830_00900 [Actinobacteria bacterium]|nr:hypothetical protein [Actinomycetota bacterium]